MRDIIITYVVLGIIVLIVLNKLKNSFNSTLGIGTSKDEQQAQTAQNNSITINTKRDGMPSMSNTQYLNLANKLYDAMKGMGTDDKSVLSVFHTVKNQTDWNMLIKTFGIHDGDNLLTWLRDDFDEHNYIGTDRSDLNKVLTSKGIKENLL